MHGVTTKKKYTTGTFVIWRVLWNWLHSNYSGSQTYMNCLFTWYFSQWIWFSTSIILFPI